MREVGAAACLVVALTGAAASAQPSSGSGTAGWRAAVSAALAFGYAEGKMLALERHSIPAALTTKKAADAALDELDRRASEARDAFLFVERYGSAYWTVAAELRIGDAFECQANTIAAIPPPPLALPPGTSPPPLDEYRAVLEGLVKPLRDQADHSWERAAAAEGSGFWSRVAHDRLAGVSRPDC